MWKEKLSGLTSTIEKSNSEFAKEDIETVELYIKKCGEYIKAVNDMESAIATARFRMEGEDYRQYIMNLDRTRKIVHDDLINSTKLINRLCEIYGYPKIYTGSWDRIEVAEFAKQIVNEFFEKRQK